MRRNLRPQSSACESRYVFSSDLFVDQSEAKRWSCAGSNATRVHGFQSRAGLEWIVTSRSQQHLSRWRCDRPLPGERATARSIDAIIFWSRGRIQPRRRLRRSAAGARIAAARRRRNAEPLLKKVDKPSTVAASASTQKHQVCDSRMAVRRRNGKPTNASGSPLTFFADLSPAGHRGAGVRSVLEAESRTRRSRHRFRGAGVADGLPTESRLRSHRKSRRDACRIGLDFITRPADQAARLELRTVASPECRSIAFAKHWDRSANHDGYRRVACDLARFARRRDRPMIMSYLPMGWERARSRVGAHRWSRIPPR